MRDGSSPDSNESDSEEDAGGSDDDHDEDGLAAAVQATSLDDSPWKQIPAYSPLYLSTVSEYLPPPPKLKMPAGAAVDADDDKDPKEKGGSGGSWAPHSLLQNVA